jgi:hypothetical protein
MRSRSFRSRMDRGDSAAGDWLSWGVVIASRMSPEPGLASELSIKSGYIQLLSRVDTGLSGFISPTMSNKIQLSSTP